MPTDVTDNAAVEALAQKAISEFGHLDIWVNNAGGIPDGKPRYLTDVPRFFAYIEAVLARRPELAPLAELLASLRPSAGAAQ